MTTPIALASTPKQVGEVRNIAFHFELEMATGETIANIDNIVIVAQGNVPQVANLVTTGQGVEPLTKQSISVLFSSGTDGETYEVTAQVTTTAGQKLFCPGLIAVANN